MTIDTTDENRGRWIEAGNLLATDPHAKVPCPACGNEFLQVEDVPAGDRDGTFSRYLRCGRCGAVEILDRLRPR